MSEVFTHQEVLVAEGNASLNLHGRHLLNRARPRRRPTSRPCRQGAGMSRQCAHRWVARFRAAGDPGLIDRSSRPHRCPRRTSVAVEQRVLELRHEQRRGQDWIGPEVGLPARTVSAILRRHEVPYLRECDPLTGEVIRHQDHRGALRTRPSRIAGPRRRQEDRPPDGGGWKAHGRQIGKTSLQKKARIGFDYVHSMVDDHSRLRTPRSCPRAGSDLRSIHVARRQLLLRARDRPAGHA